MLPEDHPEQPGALRIAGESDADGLVELEWAAFFERFDDRDDEPFVN